MNASPVAGGAELSDQQLETAIAIVGMSGRFPGADTPDELWENSLQGSGGLRPVTDEDLAEAGVDPAQAADPRYVRMAAPVSGLDMFDAGFFGFSPRDAEITDPQQRLFLECCWEALEHAGYRPDATPGQVGVFAGCGFPYYLLENILPHKELPDGTGPMQVKIGVDRDSLATMVSYKLDFTGPSVVVQTFCSTSLVAVHMACQSLLTYDCDSALAGAVSVSLPQQAGYVYEEGGIVSPDGSVRSFDANARGTVIGNGAGVVVLRRLPDALADGDRVHALILGSAVTNDGRARVGYTAPGVDGQAAVMRYAMSLAGVEPQTIDYVECHATGTPLGDSVEISAMTRVFGDTAAEPCVLGSLKPLVGHLDRASGVAGLIRTVQAMQHQWFPGVPGFTEPNQAFAAAPGRFVVPAEPRPWPQRGGPRRAGVSSFGMGGTNVHLVVQETPPAPAPAESAEGSSHLLVLSARSESALTQIAGRLAKRLASDEEETLADIAFTLQTGRTPFPYRTSLVCTDRVEAAAALSDPGAIPACRVTGRPRPRLHLPDLDAETIDWGRVRERLSESFTGIRQALATQAAASAGDEATRVQFAVVKLLLAVLSGSGDRPVVTGEGTGLRAAALLTTGAVREEADAADVDGQELLITVGPPQRGTDDKGWAALPADDAEAADAVLWDVLGRLWRLGAEVDWAALHDGHRRRVPLPTYPFERRRVWLEPPRPASTGPADLGGTRPVTDAPRAPEGPGGERLTDLADWFHVPVWRQHHLPPGGLDERLRARGPWWLLTDDGGWCDAVAARLRAAQAEFVVARPGGRPARDSGDVTGRTPSEVLSEVLRRCPAPRTVIHAWGLDPLDPAESPSAAFDMALDRGFRTALDLAGILAGRRESDEVDVLLCTDGALAVTGQDLYAPEQGALTGLSTVLTQENPGLLWRQTDLGLRTGDGIPSADRVEQFLLEACTSRPAPVALRGEAVWVRDFQPLRLEAPDVSPPPVPGSGQSLHRGATVLITGGLGDVGTVLARHLGADLGCRLVLTAGTELPPRSRWARIAERDDPQDRAARHVRTVLALEKAGIEVAAYTARAEDRQAMAEAIERARSRFGGLDAVIHAAGLSDPRYFGVAHSTDPDLLLSHFAPKVHGLLTLHDVLADEPSVSLRTAVSSLSAVLGGLGFAGYAAANSALDAYTRHLTVHSGARWSTVDWEGWRIRAEGHILPGSTVADYPMTPDEGVQAFDRALGAHRRVRHLVVSSGPLAHRLALWAGGDNRWPGGAPTAAAVGSAAPERHPRPELNTLYEPPRHGVETAVADVWADILGLEQVGALDNFFDLGGHSLALMQVLGRLRRRLRTAIQPMTLVEHPTVRSLSEALAAQTVQREESQ
jgi:acyl transferase domain-containing protein